MRKIILILFLSFWAAGNLFAQDYPQIVSYESKDGQAAYFISVGTAPKAKDVASNAVESLFYTLFHLGVNGYYEGLPLVSGTDKEYMQRFFDNRLSFFVRSCQEQSKPEKNENKIYQGTYLICISDGPLLDDLKRNHLLNAPKKTYKDVDSAPSQVLPTIMVIPFRKKGEATTYTSILDNDYKLRTAVSVIQKWLIDAEMPVVDVKAKSEEWERTQVFAGDTESYDREVIANSGADICLEVQVEEDVNADGTIVNIILNAREARTAMMLASNRLGNDRRMKIENVSNMYAQIVERTLPPFLPQICDKFTEQMSEGKKIVLNFTVAESSSVFLDSRYGSENMPLYYLIHQWVRKNAYQGKFHSPTRKNGEMFFDYVMIPPLDKDGYAMDVNQFGFYIESWLNDQLGIPCMSSVDGVKLYITIL